MRRAAVLPCALLFVAGLGLSQQPPKPEELCSVEGSVVNSRTGEPVRRALIILQRSGAVMGSSAGAMTDESGKFKLVKLDPGNYRISLRKQGFTQEIGPAAKQSQSPPLLTLTAGQTLRGLVLKLAPGAVITGRVLDESGEPMMGTAVQALRPRYVNGRREMLTVAATAADDQGNYRLAALPTGRYLLKASQGETSAGNVVDHSPNSSTPIYGNLYYPGVNEASQASILPLRAGEERGAIDFRMTPVHGVRIRGRVIPPSGVSTRMMGIALTTRGTGRRDFPMQLAREDGAFEMSGVPPGTYEVYALPFASGEPLPLQGRKAIEVAGENIEGIEVPLSTGAEIKGTVRMDGQPRNSKFSLTELTVLLAPRQGLSGMSSPSAGGGDVRADGSFTFKNVGDGDYAVQVVPLPEEFYVKAVQLGDADALDEFSINEGRAGGDLEVVISPNGGTLKGLVKDSDKKPLAGATVVLIPEEARGRNRRYASAEADQLGRYTISGIAPGAYTVYAWTTVEAGAWQDPSFLVQYKDQGQRVVIEEKAQQTADLTALEGSDSEN